MDYRVKYFEETCKYVEGKIVDVVEELKRLCTIAIMRS